MIDECVRYRVIVGVSPANTLSLCQHPCYTLHEYHRCGTIGAQSDDR